jgi:hypothetical protein
VVKSARLRWAALLSALGATLVASFYPDDDGTVGAAKQGAAQTSARAGRPGGALQVAANGTGPLAGSRVDDESDAPSEPETDPFAPRGWKAPPPPPPPVALAPVVVPGPPPPPPGPPPLPFRFTGRMNDGGEQVIYVSHGDQIFLVQTGDTLENTYKVLAVDAKQIEFEHLPTGIKQTLPLPAAEG